MLRYYLQLALRSFRRNRVLTILMVVAIGLGIGASMTMLTVLHVMNADPLPGRSGQLYYPRLDPLPADYESRAGFDPADNFTWPDVRALLEAHEARHQAALSGGRVLVRPARKGSGPFFASGRYATADFFAMFGVPFVAGHGWSEAEDRARAHLVVLSEALSRKAFGSSDAVGRTLNLDGHDFRVIGVTAPWDPQPKIQADIGVDAFGSPDRFFLPLATALDLGLQVTGNTSTWAEGKRDLRGGSTSWLQFWVQLETPAEAAAYRRFLVNYAADQHAQGRFERGPDSAALFSMRQWLDRHDLVPPDMHMQLWLALGFLVVCLVNIVALLLAKFLRRSDEICVRRALGAGRGDIFVQLGIESALIGLGGGVLGLLLAEAGLWSIRRRPDAYAHLAHMDAGMLAGTFVLAVGASLLAGLLPAWRACRIPPALRLKAL